MHAINFRELKLLQIKPLNRKHRPKVRRPIYVLLSKGPFCTPRSFIKNMTTKVRPKLDEIADYMKKLDDRHIGTFMNINQKERAYFKLIPEDDS